MDESLPVGTVTLVLCDLEGSVRLWERERQAMAKSVERVDSMVRSLAVRHGGVRPVEQGEGDSFVLAFSRPSAAVAFALAFQREVETEAWPGGLDLGFRLGVHTGEIELRDEGNYVRDLGRPERVYWLRHPDLAEVTVDRVSGARLGGVPAPVTSFVGRTEEIASITRLLPTTRVLSLIGAGGSGKTRLAISVAAGERSRRDGGVRWVELGSVSDPALVETIVAEAIGLRPRPGRDPLPALVEALSPLDSLLVLDNCEHLIEECARVVDELVRGCPDLVVLVTSREPLGVTGETTFRVPSLAVPARGRSAVADLESVESVQLFVDRAQQVLPDFALTDGNAAAVAAICSRLDGIPLAIELAAARIRLLTPLQIAEGLDDRFRLLTGGGRSALPRQRTLEASVAWSYDLLTPSEQLVLAQLSVFAGSFTIEAAERVAGAAAGGDGEPGNRAFLDLLSSLVDRSLVHAELQDDEARYRILETVRAFARERLAELDDPDAARDRHLHHFIDLAANSREGLASDAPRWLGQLGSALDDLRAAMDWAMASGRPLDVVAIVEASWGFWMVRCLFTETHRRLSEATTGADSEQDRAKALASASVLALMGGDFHAGFACADDAVAPAERSHDRPTAARARLYRAWCGYLAGLVSTDDMERDLDAASVELGEVGLLDDRVRADLYRGALHAMAGRTSVGLTELERALEMAASHDLSNLAAPVQVFMSQVLVLRGDLDRARREAREAIETGRAIGFHAFVSLGLTRLGAAETFAGNSAASAAHLREAFEVAQGENLVTFEMYAHQVAAHRAYRFDDFDTARRHAESAYAGSLDIGSRSLEAESRWILGILARLDGDTESAWEHSMRARALSDDPRYVQVLAGASLTLSHLALDDGDVAAAWEHAHESLEIASAAELLHDVADALEAIAGLGLVTDRAEQAARLLGAADRLRNQIGIARFPFERDRYPQMVASARALLGDQAFDQALAGGVSLAVGEAVAYARRGRGERVRAVTGWQSLTPAEDQIASLVAEGLTNAEVADRLFVSVNTVKTHLSHVFDKLGIGRRSELAAEVARRAS